MGSEFRGKGARNSMMWFVFISFLTICPTSSAKTEKFFNNKNPRRELDDIGGDINIDCGLPVGSSYTDKETGMLYISDKEFISSGVNKEISSKHMTETLQKSLVNVRSFPEGNRNCYTVRPSEGRETIYLIRATFMYGDYDDQNKPPEFDLYVGVNQWDSVKFANETDVVIKEIIYYPLMDKIYVCLLNTGKGIPFISALEVRHFHNSTYRTQSGALALYKRLDVGSKTNQTIRFKEDIYDRMWFPFPVPVSISTSDTIDSLVESEYRLPSIVMRTAGTPMNVNHSLNFEFEIGDPILQFYVYLHFAELESLQENQHREFSIELNDALWEKSVVPTYLRSTTIHSQQAARGSNLKFSFYKTSSSTLPPILNAMEIYVVKDFLQKPTNQEDVNAIMEVKSSYMVGQGWQGDPCSPEHYSWDGLNCSFNGYNPPQIISLNLASKGLTGKISPSLSNLKSLEHLDLSNNSLTGSVPEFLSQLPHLKTLNLEGNKLSGSVPTSLIAKSQNGSLLLSVGRNPDLCLSAPCKKKKNIVMPLVVATVSLLVISIALLSYWIFKQKRAARMNFVESHGKKEGSLKSDNQQFTYAEVVSITNNFENVLGKGGSGTVYYGSLDNGTEVAVKVLSESSAQASKHFRTEAQLLMRVHHRNLVSLIGYCNDSGKFGIIYEYMAYGNLKQYLSDKTKEVLSWKERLQIAVDAAQGLEYLHHGCKPPIIHRDVKTANILLNEKLQAKIADFGFSKFFQTESASHMSASLVGTVGYLDPEYYASNWLTEKSDVYSFGVVLLELITGQPALMGGSRNVYIVQWVGPFLERGDIRSIIDPRLAGNFDVGSVWKAVETAMKCVPSNSIQRSTMSHVVTELKECLEMEIAREQIRTTESHMLTGSSSGDTSLAYCDTESGPHAR